MSRSDHIMPPADIRPPLRLGFLLIDDFALMSFASVAEPFRAANVLGGRTLYEWALLSTGAPSARASNGAAIATVPLDPAADPDILFVCAGGNPAQFDDPATFAMLRRIARRGARIGGVSGAPWILARAGLLGGYRCTIHWEHRPAFVEAFPDLAVETGLYVIDRARLTCAGGTAGLDLAIALIAADHGPALAAMVGDWYIRTQVREGGGTQRMALRDRYGTTNERLLTALALMESHVEEPLHRDTLAARAGVSTRQLERLSAVHLGATLGETYLRIRLARALALLRESGMATGAVAAACGFASQSHFSRAFRRRYGMPPSAAR